MTLSMKELKRRVNAKLNRLEIALEKQKQGTLSEYEQKEARQTYKEVERLLETYDALKAQEKEEARELAQKQPRYRVVLHKDLDNYHQTILVKREGNMPSKHLTSIDSPIYHSPNAFFTRDELTELDKNYLSYIE